MRPLQLKREWISVARVRLDSPKSARSFKGKQRAAAIAVLDARRMGLDDKAAAVGVDQRVTLAPIDLLARIVTARAAGLCGLDALAVREMPTPTPTWTGPPSRG